MYVAGGVLEGGVVIYHQTGAGGASKGTLQRAGGAAGESASSGYTLALRRGSTSLWTAQVWAIRRRDEGFLFAAKRKPEEGSG